MSSALHIHRSDRTDQFLVWLAGPLSGLIVQPIIGSLSDSSTSPFRRRKYMLGSAVVLALSTLLIAFAEPISEAFLNAFGSGLGTWDPVHKANVQHMVQALSIIGFWVLDFALNALQVVSRALILDHADTGEQNRANAWHGRMLHIGKIVGYWSGWVDLSHSPLLAWVGGDQFRKFAIISIVCMFFGVGITCYSTPEPAAERTQGRTVSPVSVWTRMAQSVSHVWQVSRTLPPSIRSVCYVQLFNTMGWFPFLFYSTTYVINKAPNSTKKHLDDMEKLGSFAMLLFALLSLSGGVLLPFLSFAGAPDVAQDNAPSRRIGLRLATLRTIWTYGTFIHFFLLALGTWFVTSLRGAIFLVMLMGIPWSISCWVPYALIGEFVREAESQNPGYVDYWPTQSSTERVMPYVGHNEKVALDVHEYTRINQADDDENDDEDFIYQNSPKNNRPITLNLYFTAILKVSLLRWREFIFSAEHEGISFLDKVVIDTYVMEGIIIFYAFTIVSLIAVTPIVIWRAGVSPFIKKAVYALVVCFCGEHKRYEPVHADTSVVENTALKSDTVRQRKPQQDAGADISATTVAPKQKVVLDALATRIFQDTYHMIVYIGVGFIGTGLTHKLLMCLGLVYK
ncbi:hypothetical protein MCUN1_003846 [Malassezia cuniculi]|uniref:General alpha-glucoside permease n=1 Tax=Malassezia cuniculi TaxID=948313 RepID=A0AAF0EXF6_9BASI|nr:hypothetical protein MCUN1_003846 [Malassezia cuniculi]